MRPQLDGSVVSRFIFNYFQLGKEDTIINSSYIDNYNKLT